NGQTVEASLSDVFTALGLSDRTLSQPDTRLADKDREDADARAQARIRRWLGELGGGPLASIQFCHELVNQAGRPREAAALRSALAADLEGRETLPLGAIRSFYALADGAEQTGDYQAMERWANRALAMYAEFERRRRISAEPVSAAGIAQMTDQAIT